MDHLKIAAKSIWKERFTQGFAFFCPLCSSPRRLGMHPKPGQPIHYAQVFSTAMFFTLITWSFFEWKGIVSFVPLWIAFEVFYRAKVRASVVCKKCGFDPVLYLVDVERARAAVVSHWKVKFEEKGIPYPVSRGVSAPASSAAQHTDAVDAPAESALVLRKKALKSAPTPDEEITQ